jgi:hypothetical protein
MTKGDFAVTYGDSSAQVAVNQSSLGIGDWKTPILLPYLETISDPSISGPDDKVWVNIF